MNEKDEKRLGPLRLTARFNSRSSSDTMNVLAFEIVAPFQDKIAVFTEARVNKN